MGWGCLQMEEEALARREKKEMLIRLAIFKQREKGGEAAGWRSSGCQFSRFRYHKHRLHCFIDGSLCCQVNFRSFHRVAHSTRYVLFCRDHPLYFSFSGAIQLRVAHFEDHLGLHGICPFRGGASIACELYKEAHFSCCSLFPLFP